MNKLYRDTVTLYHADASAQTVVRTVLRGVCWQQGRRELPDAGGTRRGTAQTIRWHRGTGCSPARARR